MSHQKWSLYIWKKKQPYCCCGIFFVDCAILKFFSIIMKITNKVPKCPWKGPEKVPILPESPFFPHYNRFQHKVPIAKFCIAATEWDIKTHILRYVSACSVANARSSNCPNSTSGRFYFYVYLICIKSKYKWVELDNQLHLAKSSSFRETSRHVWQSPLATQKSPNVYCQSVC